MKSKSMFLLLVGDTLIAVLTLVFGHLFRFGGFAELDALMAYAGLRPTVFVTVVIFCSYFFGLYSREKVKSPVELYAAVSIGIMLSFFILSAVYYLLPIALIGSGSISLALLFFGFVQYVWHSAFQKLLELPGFAQRVLIVGVGPVAEQMAQLIPATRENYVFAGYIQPESEELVVPAEKVVGTMDSVTEVVRKHRANKLVLALTERRGVMPVKEILRCKFDGVDVVDSLSFFEDMTGKLLIENVQPSWFLFSSGFRLTPFMRIYKRALDILFSLVGILLASPIFPLVALLVKIDSPGPVIFKQLRVGELEKGFSVLKFRTMRQDAEKESGAVWAEEDDPRITRVGKFLRKSRLDEIPQLFNVLKGEMSFVGPRPERPEFVETLKEQIPFYSKRHFVKPGVTGWAQVRYPYGASVEDALEKLRFDLYHLKNYSLLLDFIIILETVKVCTIGRGSR